ncbi:MAG: ATP-binding protein [Spirulinaceae cyanobacterium]
MKVVIIDDRASAESLLTSLLRSRGHQVEIWINPGQFEQNQAYDLIFLNVLTLGTESLSFYQRLRQNTKPPYPLWVALASRDRTPALETLLNAGIDDFFLIPFEAETLSWRLTLLEKRAQERKIPRDRLLRHSPYTQAAAIKQFPYITSHHLRQTFVQVKKQLADLANPPNPIHLDPKTTQWLDDIFDRAGVMQQLIGDLLLDTWPNHDSSSTPTARQNYLIVDPNLTILETSSDADRFANTPKTAVEGQDVRLGFPELIGTEDTLAAILEGRQIGFEIDEVARLGEGDRPLYFDLYVSRPYHTLNNESRLIILLNDATERLIFQRKLLHSVNEAETLLKKLTITKDYIAKIIASMADALIVATPTGIIKTTNPATASLFGYSTAELIGQPISHLITDEKFLHYAMLGQPQAQAEVNCQRKTGEAISVSFSCAAIETEDNARDFVYIGRDITERKQAELQIQQLNASLQQRTTALELANQDLEAFSRNVSHDLRTPLSHINFFVESLVEEYGEHFDDIARDYVLQIQKSSQRMEALIRDLLQLSQVHRSDLELSEVDLSAIASNILTELQRNQPGRSVESKITHGAIALGNEGLIKILLENLIGNSWKYTSKKKHTKIEFGYDQNLDNERVYFVRDNGAGFDMSHADKLFSAFGRLHSKSEFEGTGVGLAIVHRIIERHQGRIWAESQVNCGTTFYFTLAI